MTRCGGVLKTALRLLGVALFFSPSSPWCPDKKWCEPTSPANSSISSPMPGRQRSGQRVTGGAEAACRSLAAFGSMLAFWSTSSIFPPAATRHLRILLPRHSERYSAD